MGGVQGGSDEKPTKVSQENIYQANILFKDRQPCSCPSILFVALGESRSIDCAGSGLLNERDVIVLADALKHEEGCGVIPAGSVHYQ
jgi:hypothetical protein